MSCRLLFSLYTLQEGPELSPRGCITVVFTLSPLLLDNKPSFISQGYMFNIWYVLLLSDCPSFLWHPFDPLMFCHLFLQERRLTGISARLRRLQSPCRARCLAQGTVCSATGPRGLPVLRPAPVRPSRANRWEPVPFWHTTPGKVSLRVPAAFSTIMCGNICRWSLDIGLVMAFQVVLCCHSLKVWISHLSACAFVLISNSRLICPGDYFCWSVAAPDTLFLSVSQIIS